MRIAKIQLSAAIALAPGKAAMASLTAFNNPTYLHQVKVRGPDGAIGFYPDLPEALAEGDVLDAYEEMRVHFHVPLFCQPAEPLRSTANLMTPDFWLAVKAGAARCWKSSPTPSPCCRPTSKPPTSPTPSSANTSGSWTR